MGWPGAEADGLIFHSQKAFIAEAQRTQSKCATPGV
jgi:hypothetical protein